mmetsp:Transcript_12148/g.12222  ORF Transcript_12148/g.12222 Transcript_12148/m.12222 type:complete len:179 (-) Transcript_12148:94-630(-)
MLAQLTSIKPSPGLDPNRLVDPESYGANDMPVYPARYVIQHTVMRGVQVGSVVGMVASPLFSLVRGKTLGRSMRIGLPLSAALGGSLSIIYLCVLESKGKLDIAGVDDRAYRLKHNADVQRVDQYSSIGGAAGLAIGVIASGHISTAIAASLAGIGASSVFALAGEAFIKKFLSKPKI